MSAIESPRILVFDSGVGGLSVLAEIRARLPSLSTLYAADNGFFPYGTKGEAELVVRVSEVVTGIAAEARPDLVVIACNTASTVALDALRRQLTVPVVGVVPAIKPAAEMSRSRVIGLLGTPGTVRRAYTQDLIDRFAADCTVIRVGSADLVELAERKLHGLAVDPAEIAVIVAPLVEESRTDVVVLACTHFPLLRAELTAAAPDRIRWIDSGAAIARRVETLLAQAGRLSAADNAPVHRALFTQQDEALERLAPELRRRGLSEIRLFEPEPVPAR